MSTTTSLQDKVLDGIVRLIREDGTAPGEGLVESRLARRLDVSRTPIRRALERLEELGIVRRVPYRGVELLYVPDAPEPGRETGELDELMIRLSRDRHQGTLSEEFSEIEFARRYELGRTQARRVLGELQTLGLLERKPGYGWRFQETLIDTASRQEAYLFRIVIEPAAILSPNFAVTPAWLDEMEACHQAFLARPWNDGASIEFFAMNSAFHGDLAAASGNRFLVEAVARHNQLRRLVNYQWRHGEERVRVNTTEHLEIIGKLRLGEIEVAALLMRRHIEGASRLASPFRG